MTFTGVHAIFDIDEKGLERYDENWKISLNKSGRNAPMQLRSNFREAITNMNRLHRESGEERPKHTPTPVLCFLSNFENGREDKNVPIHLNLISASWPKSECPKSNWPKSFTLLRVKKSSQRHRNISDLFHDSLRDALLHEFLQHPRSWIASDLLVSSLPDSVSRQSLALPPNALSRCTSSTTFTARRCTLPRSQMLRNAKSALVVQNFPRRSVGHVTVGPTSPFQRFLQTS